MLWSHKVLGPPQHWTRYFGLELKGVEWTVDFAEEGVVLFSFVLLALGRTSGGFEDR